MSIMLFLCRFVSNKTFSFLEYHLNIIRELDYE